MTSANRPSRLSTLHRHSRECFLVYLTCVTTGYDEEGDVSDRRFEEAKSAKSRRRHGRLRNR